MNNQFTPEQEEWLQALESGKYMQGRKWLNKGGNMCCLGVACELFKEKLRLNVVDAGAGDTTQSSQIAPQTLLLNCCVFGEFLGSHALMGLGIYSSSTMMMASHSLKSQPTSASIPVNTSRTSVHE
jgi:hypothetical protein